MPKVSRREFLKYLAAGGIVTAAGFGGLGSFFPADRRIRPASAQLEDPAWVDGPLTQYHSVHVALLPNGKVLCVAGSGYELASRDGPYGATIWDPITDTETEILPRLGDDLFCAGHAYLASGKILLVGGTLTYQAKSANKKWWGLDAAYEYDYTDNSFEKLTDMAHGRWYPTLVTLDNGKVQIVSGNDEFGYENKLTEVYDPDTQSFTISFDPNSSKQYTVGCDGTGCAVASNGDPIPGAGETEYGGSNMGVNPGLGLYPRMHLMPSGLVAHVGQTAGRQNWDPETGRWRGAGSGTRRSYGTSVLLPLENTEDEKGRILVCGGSEKTSLGEESMDTAELLEPNGFGFIVHSVPSMKWKRRYFNPVILPTGKIIVFGGTEINNSPSRAVYEPELYDPETNTWEVLQEHTVPRIYHSGALLLQDGRVWTIGTSYGTSAKNGFPVFDLRTEIYRPPYFFADRPIISGTTGGEYGGNIAIQTPNAQDVEKVSLVKISTTTHHYNTDQRLIWLNDLVKGSNEVTVAAPINSRLAPPGYYMVHIINDQGIPSEGAMINIQAAPPQSTFYDVESPGNEFMTLKAGGDTRAGVDVLAGSKLIGKELEKWTVYLKKVSSPSGTITATVRNGANDNNPLVIGSIDASALTTIYSPIQFTMSTPHTIKANDRILVEYSGPNGVRIDAWGIDKFDGSKTRRVKFGSTGTYSGTAMNSKDTSGIMSSE
jgi:hypothetical protein